MCIRSIRVRLKTTRIPWVVAALKIIFRFEVGDLRLEVYFCTAAEEDNKKTLTLEKKEHETLTLGKKATRAWKKVEKNSQNIP